MNNKKSLIKNQMTFNQIHAKVSMLLSKYIKENNHVLKQIDPKKIATELNLKDTLKNGFDNVDSMMAFIKNYLSNTNHLKNPGYMGHQVAVPQDLSGIPEMIHGTINNPSSLYEMGPSASVIESFMINWMLKKLNWFKGNDLYEFKHSKSYGSGFLTHGGSVANLTILSAARASISPDSWVNGTPNNLVVMGASSAHYSISRSLSIMGMGSNSFIPIPVDHEEKCIIEELYKTYEKVKKDGKKVMAVVANACATSTGLFDPINEMAVFCSKNNIWFHVDAAHGAIALLSKKEKHKLKGIKKADSIIWDAHKMMRVPSLCTAVLFKNYTSQIDNFKQKGSYVFHNDEVVGMDTMPYTIECTKSPLGPKLFWTFALEGEKSITNYVENSFKKAKELYIILNKRDDFSCPYSPESNILCFKYLPSKLDCKKQLKLRYKIIQEGSIYLTSCIFKNERFLRVVIINPDTSKKDFKKLIQVIIEIGSKL
jgi:L-2,4-diaminobutyrate decarboxylase